MRNNIHFMHLDIRSAGSKGRGVFATSPIRKGMLVSEMSGEIVPTAQLTDDMLCLQVGVDAWLCSLGDQLDDCINHSCAPNTGFTLGTPTLYALRDIGTGEEITFDYSTSLSAPEWELECGCGAAPCRKDVLSWPMLNDDLKHRLRPISLEYLRHPPF